MSTFYRGIILIKPATATEHFLDKIEEVFFEEGFDVVVSRDFYLSNTGKNETIELTIDQNVRSGLDMEDFLFRVQSVFGVEACLWVDCDTFKGGYIFTKPKGFPYTKDMELLRAGFILDVVMNLGLVNNPGEEIITLSQEETEDFLKGSQEVCMVGVPSDKKNVGKETKSREFYLEDTVLKLGKVEQGKFIEAIANESFVPNEKLLEAVTKHHERKDGRQNPAE